MLSLQRISFTRYSPRCIRDKTTVGYVPTPSSRVTSRLYGQWVPEKLLMNEKDVKKYKIDPRIRALTKKIIYSDYIERKSLRFSRGDNIKILGRMRCRAKEKTNKELMETPAMSVALKYFMDERNKAASEERTFDIDESEVRAEFPDSDELPEPPISKPVHMPYASTDHYENVCSSEVKEETEIPELNQEYKELYEKYLESKNSGTLDFFEQITEDTTTQSKNLKHKPTNNTTNVPPNWMTDYEQYNDIEEGGGDKPCYGTPDPKVPISSIPCGGCGALLHCRDSALPGYLPSELFTDQETEILRSSLCQRCHFMKNYNTMLDVTVSPEEYPTLLNHIKGKKAAILLMVDLTDFPCSIWPGIVNIITKTTRVFVVGNKVDLLPKDSPHFIKNVEQSLLRTLDQMGISKTNIKDIVLISAKTGYGIESLINKLHKNWAYKGDVYLIGCTNVGKSSLFNALLRSDYCKVQAADLVQRATVSPWPGTTLNLLKFPILNPVRWRLWMRTQRLMAERAGLAEVTKYRTEKYKDTKKLEYASLQGHIGTTFSSRSSQEDDSYFGKDDTKVTNESGRLGLNENEKIYKYSRWCYDTPGAILPDQLLHFLTTEELLMTLPQHVISPRSFALYKTQSLFLAGLGRLDFLGGSYSIICTVFANNKLPITVCKTADADQLYRDLLETEAFMVPINDPERLKLFPSLESKFIEVTGMGHRESAADIVLSSAGWIAVTAPQDKKIEVRAWTPEGRGIHLRTPALLSKSVTLRGYRIPYSPAFTRGQQVKL